MSNKSHLRNRYDAYLPCTKTLSARSAIGGFLMSSSRSASHSKSGRANAFLFAEPLGVIGKKSRRSCI